MPGLFTVTLPQASALARRTNRMGCASVPAATSDAPSVNERLTSFASRTSLHGSMVSVAPAPERDSGFAGS